jgi:hypothetical protein
MVQPLIFILIMRSFRLPKLRDDAQQALAETLKGLGQLPPPPPDNPTVELLRLLTVFSTETKQWVDGAEQKEGLVRNYKRASAKFKSNIRRTGPNFKPFKDADEEISFGPFRNIPEDESSADLATASGVGGVDVGSPMYLLEVRQHIAE